jgi:hypothetical protein
MSEYKKKPLWYILRQWYEDTLCTPNGIFYPIQWYRNFTIWYSDTFISPHNVLQIKTLKKSWVDRDEKLLHANFQILSDFVEKECNVKGSVFRLKIVDVDKEMLDYKDYDEEMKKGIRESIINDNRLKQEILDLYDWWNVKRPLRIKNNPIYREDFPGEDIITDDDKVVSRNEYGDPEAYLMNWKPDAKRMAYYDEIRKYEEMEDQEDNEMLIRLIKIRKNLWT